MQYYKSMNVRVYLSYDIKITFEISQCGLSILVHGVISLPDATSYDKHNNLIDDFQT